MPKYVFTKDSKLQRPRNIDKNTFISASYGQEFVYEPSDVPLRIYHFSESSYLHDDYRFVTSLKNIINRYSAKDDIYVYNNIYNKPVSLYSFSSAHLGSGIDKGSVEINLYLSGNLLATTSDIREDGVLYSGSNDEKVGFILYDEGFIIINNSSSLTSDHFTFATKYDLFDDNLRWIHAFASCSDSLYFDINYTTKNDVCTNITFVEANKNSYNHSNNLTYIKHDSYDVSTGSYHFIESDSIQVRNTVKSPFNSGSANFEKQTFITKIGLFDEEKKLIGIARLANPVKKTENREYLFKLKLDI